MIYDVCTACECEFMYTKNIILYKQKMHEDLTVEMEPSSAKKKVASEQELRAGAWVFKRVEMWPFPGQVDETTASHEDPPYNLLPFSCRLAWSICKLRKERWDKPSLAGTKRTFWRAKIS